MLYRAVKRACGRLHWQPGQIVEMDAGDARELLAGGAIERIVDETSEPIGETTEPISETLATECETEAVPAETKPAAKRRRKK
jgi:hypothetical protein